MEKILLALDAAKADTGALAFASYLATLTESKVIGVFLEKGQKELNLVEWEADAADSASLQGRSENILFFTRTCERKHTRYSVHTDNGDPIKALITESRFADVLVLSPETSFSRKPEAIPTSFVKNILRD